MTVGDLALFTDAISKKSFIHKLLPELFWDLYGAMFKVGVNNARQMSRRDYKKAFKDLSLAISTGEPYPTLKPLCLKLRPRKAKGSDSAKLKAAPTHRAPKKSVTRSTNPKQGTPKVAKRTAKHKKALNVKPCDDGDVDVQVNIDVVLKLPSAEADHTQEELDNDRNVEGGENIARQDTITTKRITPLKKVVVSKQDVFEVPRFFMEMVQKKQKRKEQETTNEEIAELSRSLTDMVMDDEDEPASPFAEFVAGEEYCVSPSTNP